MDNIVKPHSCPFGASQQQRLFHQRGVHPTTQQQQQQQQQQQEPIRSERRTS
jgi:hypothetical protein